MGIIKHKKPAYKAACSTREALGEGIREVATYSTVGSMPSATISKPWVGGSESAIGAVVLPLTCRTDASGDTSGCAVVRRGAGNDGRLRDQGSSREKRDDDMATASASKYHKVRVENTL